MGGPSFHRYHPVGFPREVEVAPFDFKGTSMEGIGAPEGMEVSGDVGGFPRFFPGLQGPGQLHVQAFVFDQGAVGRGQGEVHLQIVPRVQTPGLRGLILGRGRVFFQNDVRMNPGLEKSGAERSLGHLQPSLQKGRVPGAGEIDIAGAVGHGPGLVQGAKILELSLEFQAVGPEPGQNDGAPEVGRAAAFQGQVRDDQLFPLEDGFPGEEAKGLAGLAELQFAFTPADLAGNQGMAGISLPLGTDGQGPCGCLHFRRNRG